MVDVRCRMESFVVLLFLVQIVSNTNGLQTNVLQQTQNQPVLLQKTTDSVLRNIVVGAVAGAAAGFITDVACYPIEAIKTRLQSGSVLDVKRPKSLSITSCVNSLKSLLSGVEVLCHD